MISVTFSLGWMTRPVKSLRAWFTNWKISGLRTKHGFWRSSRPGRWEICPREIVDDLESSKVSIFAVQAQANELKSRMQMTDVVNRRKIRHAHMVNINHQIMLEGMRADFLK